jgi:hypothetical protein
MSQSDYIILLHVEASPLGSSMPAAPMPPPAVGVQTRLQKGIKHLKNIPMALFPMLFCQLQENQKNCPSLLLMQIGSMLCKMNMMLLLPTIPGT